MESETVGRVLTEATIGNLEDLRAAKRGLIPADRARRVVVADALAGVARSTAIRPAAGSTSTSRSKIGAPRTNPFVAGARGRAGRRGG